MTLKLEIWEYCRYCGKDFRSIGRRRLCDDCLYNHAKNPPPKNTSTARMIRNRTFIRNYKKDKSCSVCGYNKFPEILDFHHKDRREKHKGVNQLSKSLKSIHVIQREIEKCTLICPNCHRELHLKERIEDEKGRYNNKDK